ncbi:MAG: dockerin type I repeat-containing protein [bacterium]|nr:dockerin type I repeat-containing protein [bacterium]
MNTTKPSRLSILASLLGITLLAGESLGQFVPGGGTLVRERVAGVLRLSSDAPVPVDGDQIAAFYNGQIVSEVFQFTVESAESLEYSVVVFGDDPSTEEQEGPAVGETVEFRFYRQSTNVVYKRLGTLNQGGEVFNYQFNGQELPDFIGDLPFPIDLIPTAPLDLRLTNDPEDSGGSVGGGDGDGGEVDDTPNYDVDGDGRITIKDAAEILRVMSGASFRVVPAARADANKDGKVDIRDVIGVLRNRT